MRKKGFSLVEIMIVLAIAGIIISVIIPNVLSVIEDVRRKKSFVDIEQMQKDIKFYYEANNRWPLNFTQFMDLTEADKSAPDNPWGIPYRMDEQFFYVEDNAGNVDKFFYRKYNMNIFDGAMNFKIEPVFYWGHDEDSQSWYNNERGANPENLQFYFRHSIEGDNTDEPELYFFIEANTQGAGTIRNFELSNMKIPFAEGLDSTDIELSDNLDITGSSDNLTLAPNTANITDNYAGMYVRVRNRGRVSISFTVEEIEPNGNNDAYFGYISKDARNFIHLGDRSGQNPEYYRGRTYEIIFYN
ncbi:MAG: type II secretion system protein [Candidatus Muiribacteriota bacterium]